MDQPDEGTASRMDALVDELLPPGEATPGADDVVTLLDADVDEPAAKPEPRPVMLDSDHARVSMYASSPSSADALLPIWRELRQRGAAGAAYSPREGDPWREAPLPRREALRGAQPVIVGSYVDYQRVAPAPVVYVVRDVEQSHGYELDRVVLFVVVDDADGDVLRERYPSTPVAVADVYAADNGAATLAADAISEVLDGPAAGDASSGQ